MGTRKEARRENRTSATTDRDPRERFLALANSRVNTAIRQLRLIGNLANRKNYAYEPEEAVKIIRALQRELDELRAKFKGEHERASDVFKL